jgi:hypothetical protein
LRTHGQEFKKLSSNLIAIAGSIDNDAHKVNSGFIEASQKTLQMIDDLAKATEHLKSQDLPKAIAALKATAGNLRQASTEAHGVERFVVSLLLAGLVLAVLFAFNSVGVLLIVESLNQSSAKPSPSVPAA